jgi:hypothetical protein
MNQSILEAAREILLGEANNTFELPKDEKELMAMVKNAKNIKTTPKDDAGYNLFAKTSDKVAAKLDSIFRNEKPWSDAYDAGYDGEKAKNPFRQGTLAHDLWNNAYKAGESDS